ncbi:MAG: succinate dehydrogenase cytochrome b subunit [Saprospiraceae bacterium]|nr:succinate dehydrogenase cytochrome b subunit [Saprospiraceae bacterium]
MNWFSRFLTSSLGKKLLMSLTGLFLISFLIIHLIGNFQLLIDDGGKQFNVYAKFMTTNPVIKTVSYLLYGSILLHAVQGLLIWRENRVARGGTRYAVKVTRAVNTSAKLSSNMGWLGAIVLVFILVHMYQFWLQMKLGNLPMATYDGQEYKDLYTIVAAAYQNIFYVIFYVVSMLVIAFHLWHGFQSSFQTLGLNHRKYTPFIHVLGKLIAVVIPLGFAVIPVFMFLLRNA